MPNWEAYREADRRGILPPQKKDLYEEAKRRGLVPSMETSMQGSPPPLSSGGQAAPVKQEVSRPPQQEQSYINMDYPSILPDQTDLKYLHWTGKMLAGGILRGIKGAVPLPFDIAAHFGLEKAEKIADTIRKNIPQVKEKGTVEDISMTFSQYAIPATLSIKLANLVLQGAPLAVKFIGGLLAGGLGDFIAATPEEGTIGDIIGAGPTATQKGESVYSRKSKIAYEGTIVPVPIIGAIKATGVVAKMIGHIASPAKYVRRAVAKALQDQAIDIEKALAEIDKNLTAGLVENFKPTTGTLSGDPALIGIEKYSAQQPEFLARKELNMKVISDELERTTQAAGGDPQRAKKFFEDYLVANIEGKTNAVEVAEKAWRAVEIETDNLVHQFSFGKGKQAEASLILDDIARQKLDSLTAKKNHLFKNIDPENTVVIPKDRIKEAFKEMLKRESALDSTPEKIPKDLKNRIFKILAAPKKGEKEIQLTFGALQDLRPDLSEAIAAARKADQGGVVERLSTFKKAAEGETNFLAQRGDEAATKAKEAINFYQDEFAPKFKEGVGKLFRRAIRVGDPWPGTATGGKFLFKPTGATEAAEQLKKIATGPEAEAAMREYLIGTVADQMVNAKSGAVAANRLAHFMNQRPVRETLSKFPAVKKEIVEFQDKLRRGIEKETVLSQQIELAKQSLNKTKKEMSESAARYFVDTNPQEAVAGALRSSDPEKTMKELVALTKQDKSGEALNGLRKSLGDHLNESLRGTTEIGGELEVLRSKVVKLFSNAETKKALAQLYSPSEMQTIETITNTLQIMNRINKQVTSGSPTASITEQITKTRIVLASLYGIVKGRGIFAISGWLAKTFNRDPVVLSKALLTDAMLDPALGKTLLMMDNKGNEKLIKQHIGAYIANNLMTVGTKGPDVKTPEEVKAAFDSGKFGNPQDSESQEKAANILRSQFGFE